MTLKALRLLAIALSFWAGESPQAQSTDSTVQVADNWVPLPLETGETSASIPEPLPPETVFSNTGLTPPLPAEPLNPELKLTDPPVTIEGEEEVPFGRPYNAPGWYSRPERDDLNWRSGSNSRFGEFSFAGVSAFPLTRWDGLSLTVGHGFHFLDGPSISDMPPRLFDFNAGLHYFGEVLENAWIDMAFSAGIYTDFEDSAREGWRFPAHAVFSWELVPDFQPVIGVKYYDRDTLGLLPVAGVIWQPEKTFRAELVFPEPKVAWQIADSDEQQHWLSFSGRIGGGQWAIEREPSGLADAVTYNDYELVIGLDTIDKQYKIQSLEIGYSFHRKLEYRSGIGDFDPAETMFIRMVTRR